eukprot:g63805.t1
MRSWHSCRRLLARKPGMRWSEGKDRGVFEEKTEVGSLWKLDKKQRQLLKEKWNREWLLPQQEGLASKMRALATNLQSMKALRAGSKARVLQTATIIGCTTVAAAKSLELKEVQPNVVLVEEAGEILEAHVLINLSPLMEQVIMIGDHQQLRPKIENYSLRMEARRHFDLDMSLFERLVLARSAEEQKLDLPMTIYPDLQDHVSTLHLRGTVKDVVFVKHENPEAVDADAQALGSQFHINQTEVEWVVAIACHVLAQGYQPSQITILTPYLGQLSEIRRALDAKKIRAVLNDLDRGDLLRLDMLDSESGSKEEKAEATNQIRAATVVNFQGEEADVIIISMVRSNKQRSIGFLNCAERVDVLLSRARLAQFIVGNMDCLTRCSAAKGRALWSQINSLFEQHNQVLDFFPAKCEQHQTLQKIRLPSDFNRLSPHGGCDVPCMAELPCGHRCPLQCHPTSGAEAVHARSELCTEEVPAICPYGHEGKRLCSTGMRCQKEVKWMCPRAQHTHWGQCHVRLSKRCALCQQQDEREKEALEREQKLFRELQEAQLQRDESKTSLDSAERKQQHAQELAATKRETQTMRKRAKQLTAEADALISSGKKCRRDNDEDEDEAEVPTSSSSVTVSSSDAIIAGVEDSQVLQPGEHHCVWIGKEDFKVALPIKVKPHHTPTRFKPSKMYCSKCPSSLGIVCAHKIYSGPCFKAADVEFLTKDGVVLAPKWSQCEFLPHMALPKQVACKPASKPVATSSTFPLAESKQKADKKTSIEATNDSIEPLLVEILKRKQPHPALKALSYILHEELDPGSAKHDLFTASNISQPTNVADAVCCWAQLLLMRKRFPMQAAVLAQGLKTFVSTHLDLLPKPCSEVVEKSLAWKHHHQRLVQRTGLILKRSYRLRWRNKRETAQHRLTIFVSKDPGTGKTTVANHYCLFLQQLGVLPEGSAVIKTSGVSLINKGVKFLEEKLDEMKEQGGGVIFIDEAYSLVSDRRGNQLLDFILPLAEGLRSDYGSLVWVLAGYKKDMEKLFEQNVGLPSRFALRFHFEDYTDHELGSIFESLMKFQTPLEETKEQKKPVIPSRSAGLSGPSVSPFNLQNREYSPAADGQKEKDVFGNEWTFDSKFFSWHDDFGNSTGYGVANLGSSSNPLCCLEGNVDAPGWNLEI